MWPKRFSERWLGASTGSAGIVPVATFRGWLWTIARNEARNHFARLAKSPQVIGGSDLQARLAEIPEHCADDSDGSQGSSETAGVIHRALDVIRGDFQEQTWLAFVRTAVDGRSAPEVAAELGMTKRAVRQAKYRVLQRLRRNSAI